MKIIKIKWYNMYNVMFINVFLKCHVPSCMKKLLYQYTKPNKEYIEQFLFGMDMFINDDICIN